MSEVDVRRALNALDGEYICVNWASRHVGPGIGVIVGITPRPVERWACGRRPRTSLTGCSPHLMSTSRTPTRKLARNLIKIRAALGGTARALFVDVVGAVVTKSITG